MRFAGPKVRRVFQELEGQNLNADEFQKRIQDLTKIELRQLGRMFLISEKTKGGTCSEEFIRVLRRQCKYQGG